MLIQQPVLRLCGQIGIAGAAIDPRSLAAVSGLTLAYVGKDITLSNGTKIKGLGGLARALEGQGVANILSTPNLLTLDNAEAKIIVGKTVPFLTGSFSQAGSSASTTGVVNPFQTIERQDVGLTLKIKPQISEGGSIKLKILQEVSTVESAAGLGALIRQPCGMCPAASTPSTNTPPNASSPCSRSAQASSGCGSSPAPML